MPRGSTLLLLCLLLSLSLIRLSAAGSGLRIDEQATRARFTGGKAVISLAVENSSGRKIVARLILELLDPLDRIRAALSRDVEIGTGPSSISLELPLAEASEENNTEILWYRLHYQLRPAGPTVAPADGIISLSEIAPDIFELRVAASEYAREGMRYRACVRALHPATRRPVSDVAVEGKIELGDEDKTLKAGGVTDAEGYAALDFELPGEIGPDPLNIKITARRGDFTQTAEADIRLFDLASILLSTDKPLYQPGQALRVRTLALGPAKRALAGAPLLLRVRDPDGTNVFRASLKTSRFGVASAEWPIPENVRLGEYTIEVELDDGRYKTFAGQRVKISRYELPTFTVTVKPDRSFYLPGQSAEVEVRADYLFGQPVKRGRVRIVREIERQWDFRNQRWQSSEGDKYEGEIDANGRFIAHLDFTKDFAQLAGEDYARFRDLSYAAYVTDLTTNRTEQRRFDLRLTKDPIHVYVISTEGQQASDQPLQFYISTFYADGAPAECEVMMSQVVDSDSSPPGYAGQSLGTVRTNRYGVAKVSGLALARRTDGNNPAVILRARDRQGDTGQHTESFVYSNCPSLRIETDRTIHRAGEPIKAEIISPEKSGSVIVDLTQDWITIDSQVVRLSDGRGRVMFPDREGRRGVYTIEAYSSKGDVGQGDCAFMTGARAVIYPGERELGLDVQFARATYRPGEEAEADFTVKGADGRAVESALGVVVFDKAVEERARTDQEFGPGYSFYDSFCYFQGYTDTLAGVTRKDLDRLDTAKPLPDGLDLVAEILLNRSYNYVPQFFRSEKYESGHQAFAHLISAQLDPLQRELALYYTLKGAYPTNEDMLRRLLITAGIDFDELRDPWGMPYRAAFGVEKGASEFHLWSAGPDKLFGTPDDFSAASASWAYFRFTGEAISRAIERYRARTGGFIRDEATLKSELRREGLDFDALRDPWDQPYALRFEVSGASYTVSVWSGGPSRRVEKTPAVWTDDFLLWTTSISYVAEMRARVDAALTKYFRSTLRFPQDETELRTALTRAGIDWETLRDPWGRRYYATFHKEARYSDRVEIQSRARYGQQPKERIHIIPVTQQINYITLRSSGADGQEGTADDFDAARFFRLIAEQSGQDQAPQPASAAPALKGATGAISGTTTDTNGAVISQVTVTATNTSTNATYQATSDSNGLYIIRNLPAGSYQVRFEASGFKAHLVSDVPVRSSNITRLDVGLEIGAVMETVTVTADAQNLQTESATAIAARSEPVSLSLSARTSTPRLREYFPETLVWQPELETDQQGRAQLKFRLADNITTWKMAVIGSTIDGQVGAIEKEIRAFQPFFIEHDPPRVLTEGDEVALPVVVRNYLDRAQAVGLEMKPEDWFTLLGPSRKQAFIQPGDAARETFLFRAVTSVKEGKQRVAAIGADESDAVEKPVSVHPDGEEVTETTSQIFSDQAALDIVIPDNALTGSARAELKIYPNLMAHVLESIEGILQRPYGCGEQTISSTYPSLVLLRYYKRSGGELPSVAAKAQRYVKAGYERLLNYRKEGGSFSYWGHGNQDLALTAYALHFLNDASDVIEVDEEIVKETRDWLIRQQLPDGSWGSSDKRRAALTTAYIARMIAGSIKLEGTSAPAQQQPDKKTAAAAVKRALGFLAREIDRVDEPYLIASYALAAVDAGETAEAKRALARLRALARPERDASYWALETNTPFYGWGLTGRVETTALAVQALARGSDAASDQGAEVKGTAGGRDDLVNRGLIFLLRQKDRYGVWHSTQATVNVLDALVALVGAPAGGAWSTGGPAEIFVNGRLARSVMMPADNLPAGPLMVDLSPFIAQGANRIEVRRAAGGQATAQVVATHYAPWLHAAMASRDRVKTGPASALRLAVQFDKTVARINEEITCRVRAERAGHAGYGMLLAEIGLPPGADVDRAALDRALRESGWTISRYDLLPDRLLVYLWPRAGGTSFEFKFRPRYGLRAQSAPSTVYDYYNPEARAVVAPTRFLIW
jgi:hypothetical protein